MFYLVQENVFQERHYHRIFDALNRLGLEYKEVKFVPFYDMIVEPCDTMTEEPVEIDIRNRADVWCWGGTSMAKVREKYNLYPASMLDENHDFRVYGKQYGEHMLNSDSLILDFDETLPEDYLDTFFARPTFDSKAFKAQLYARDVWEAYVQQCKNSNSTSYIKDEGKVLFTSPKNIEQEIRCWIVGGKVVTISQYKTGRSITYKNLDGYDTDAWNFAQKMADIYCVASAFVLDICRSNGELKVLEVNCINAAGFYDSNLQKLLMALEDHFNFKLQ